MSRVMHFAHAIAPLLDVSRWPEFNELTADTVTAEAQKRWVKNILSSI